MYIIYIINPLESLGRHADKAARKQWRAVLPGVIASSRIMIKRPPVRKQMSLKAGQETVILRKLWWQAVGRDACASERHEIYEM